MAVVYAISSGNWSSGAIWNTGSVPTSADDVFTNSFTVAMDTNATVNSLNNTARARDIATPAMTANNAPSPYVAAASSIFSAAYDAFQAFNRNYATGTYWATAANVVTGWLSIDFGSSIIIDGYTIYGSDGQARNPRNWTLEGSNNNSTWTVLHTVSGAAAIPASGTYSISSIGNTTGYRYYRVNITLNGGSTANVAIAELELYQPGTASLVSGGSFNFNTAGVTVSATSTSASLSAGATNLITVTATTGTVTLNLNSPVQGPAINSSNLISHTGGCNLTLNGIRFTGGFNATSALCINKSSTANISVTGDIVAGFFGNSTGLSVTNGNATVVGNIFGVSGSTAIIQSAGNLTVTGNVTGGFTTDQRGINFSGILLTVNGNVTGGSASGAAGVICTTNTTINGNIFANVVSGVISTSANTINVTGDVYASATANGISSTSASGVVNLTGNMYNGLGRNAIYCQNVFISNTATTLWRVDTGGGDYKFLYSADTTPNLPATTNVRSGVTFGPALSLTGTMVVPAASNVRTGVAVDNTVGTGELTSADIISGINASSDPLAVRLKNALTDVTAGNIISQYKDS
jgi:hypothetical protein